MPKLMLYRGETIFVDGVPCTLVNTVGVTVPDGVSRVENGTEIRLESVEIVGDTRTYTGSTSK